METQVNHHEQHVGIINYDTLTLNKEILNWPHEAVDCLPELYLNTKLAKILK